MKTKEYAYVAQRESASTLAGTTCPAEGWKICATCHRLLPPDCFPPSGPCGRLDSRCRECHRLRMRLRRLKAPVQATHPAGGQNRPSITAAPCRDERIRLIREALRTVRERTERCRRHRHLREFRDETGWNATLLYK